jgi:hypothetical protein
LVRAQIFGDGGTARVLARTLAILKLRNGRPITYQSTRSKAEQQVLYTVQPGDSLIGLALRYLGNRNKWTVIAEANHLSAVTRLRVGSVLRIPGAHETSVFGPRRIDWDSGAIPSGSAQQANTLPGRGYMFVLADEINPLTRKVVRRVVIPQEPLDPALLERLLAPERFGFIPRSPGGSMPVGRHVLGRIDSNYTSASEHLLGSPRFEGQRYWIDVAKTEEQGARIVEATEIADDLKRIASKYPQDTLLQERIERIGRWSREIDREVLIEGAIPAQAVKGGAAMAATRAFQFVEGVGIFLTIYDLSIATRNSLRLRSAQPIVTEVARQAGGWSGALAGLRLGAMGGAALGIETGPGAVVTAAVGGVIGGIIGFYGAEWMVDHASDHPVITWQPGHAP